MTIGSYGFGRPSLCEDVPSSEQAQQLETLEAMVSEQKQNYSEIEADEPCFGLSWICPTAKLEAHRAALVDAGNQKMRAEQELKTFKAAFPDCRPTHW